jgi:hypothetical protein
MVSNYIDPNKKTTWEDIMEMMQPSSAQAASALKTEATMPKQPDITAADTNPMQLVSASYSGPSPEERAMEAEILKKMKESMGSQQQNIIAAQEAYNKEAEDARNKPGLARLDLRPFAEAVKGYGATTVAAQLAPEDRSEFLRKLRQDVQHGQGALTDDEINFLKTQLASKQAARQEGTQARFLAGKDADIYRDVVKKFEKPAEGIQTFYQSSDAVKQAFQSGDMFSIQSALSNFARMNGEKGVLTDQDIARVMPANLKTKAISWWSKVSSDPTVQAPPEVLDALMKNMDRLQTAAEDRYKKDMGRVLEETKYGPMSYPKHGQNIYSAAMKAIRKPENANAGMNIPDQSKIDEELKRRGIK